MTAAWSHPGPPVSARGQNREALASPGRLRALINDSTPASNNAERANLVFAAQVQLLHQSGFAAAINSLNAIVVGIVLLHSFPVAVLAGWVGLTGAVTAIRYAMRSIFLGMSPDGRNIAAWARYFCAGSFASGALWGAICLALVRYGQPRDYLFLTLVAAGMSAGALVSQSAYLPALLSYLVPMVLAMAAACLASADPGYVATGYLMLVYLAVVVVLGRNMNHSIVRMLSLGIDNEILNSSLTTALVERDDARAEKWNTLAQLSHELRTPLNAVVGFSQLMQDQIYGPLGNEKYREYVGHVQTSSGYLLKLADQILELAQGETGMLGLAEGVVELQVLMRNCHNMVAESARRGGVELTWSASARLPRLRGDVTKLHEIALNLVSNAIKFTPQGGRVSMEGGLLPDRRLELVVRDTGIGMQEQDIVRALKPFVRIASALTSKTDGAGLGLSICKRLVDLHGAELILTSVPGKGTTCRVVFPAARTVNDGESSVAASALAGQAV